MRAVSTVPNDARRVFLAGLALALAASAFSSSKAVVVKLAYGYGVDAATLLALRMLFAAPFFVVAFVWSSRGKLPLSRRDHVQLVLLGLLGYYASSYLDFLGLQYVTAALERLVLYIHPTIVVLLSALLFKHRLRRIDAIAFVLAYSGIAAAFWHDVSFEGGNVALGSALVFGSAVTYAVYLVLAGRLVGRVGAVRLTSYAMLVSTAAVILQFLVLNPVAALAQPAPVHWLSLVNGVVCTVLPVIATMLAIERFGAANTSMVSLIGPVITILLAWALLGETLSVWGIAGTLLVVAGVFVLSRKATLHA